MFCPNCGSQLPPQSSFCPVCGNRNAAAPAEPISPSQPTPYGQPYPPPPPAKKSPIGIILGLGVSILVVVVVIALFTNGILSWPFKPGGRPQATTTGRPSTSVQPTKAPTPKPSGTSATTASSVTTVTTAPTTTATPTGIDLSPDEILDYFEDIALRREYGGGEFDGVVCRWEQTVKVEIKGDYTQADYDFLLKHIQWMNKLDSELPDIKVVESGGNYRVTFTALEDLPDEIPGYVEGNWGFISLRWDSNGRITGADMGIATDVTSQTQRNHLILEEFTQGFGLLNDNPLYQDSIFQSDWTEIQSLSPLDALIIRMLYSPVLKAGMKTDVRDKLASWLLTQDY